MSIWRTVSRAPKVGPPAVPTSLTATAVGRNRIDLSWTGPTMDGGSSITGYRIESSADGLNGWSDVAADTGSTAINAEAALPTGPRPLRCFLYSCLLASFPPM